MQKRSFLLLLAATVMMVAAAGYTLVQGDRSVRLLAPARPAFPGLAARLGDLAWMRIVHGPMVADFALIAGRWAVVKKGNYPAAPSKVRRLLLGLADLTLVEPKTRRPALFGRLGLDDPREGKSTLVALQDRTGTTVAELIVGKSRPDLLGGGNDGVYVRKPGEDRTWLARGMLDLPGDMTGWLDRRIIDLAALRIAAATLTGADGATVLLRRAKPGGSFAIADPPPEAKFKDEAALAAPAGALVRLELDDVKPAADLPVPANGVATASFATFDGLVVEMRLFVQGKTDWVAVAASGNGKADAEAAAIDARVERWVYAIPADQAKLMRTKLADLMQPARGR